MSLFLSENEVRGVTGRVKPSAQLRWLSQAGINAKRRADGTVLVSRRHYEDVMAGGSSRQRRAGREPDFSALNAS